MSPAPTICIISGALAAAAEAVSLRAVNSTKPPQRSAAATASTVVPVYYRGCYFQAFSDYNKVSFVTSVGDCLAAAQGSKYMAFHCAHTRGWVCWYGNHFNTRSPTDEGRCVGQIDVAFGCYGFPSAGTFTTEYNGKSFVLGGSVAQAVYALFDATSSTTLPPSTSSSTTAPPVPATPSAYRDPHLVNTRGEKFDVNQPGKHALLVIPRGGSSESAQLHVEMQITPRGKLCGGAMYMTGITVAGAWLGALGPMKLTTSGEGFLTADMLGITLAGSANLTVQEFTDLVPRALATLSALHPEAEPSRLNEHVTTHAARLSLGPTTMKITWVHQKEKVGFSNSLAMCIIGLGKVDAKFGGLLGEGSHARAEEKPELCRKHRLAVPAAGEAEGPAFRLAEASLMEGEEEEDGQRQA